MTLAGKFTAPFTRPAAYNGTDAEYNRAVSNLAAAFRYGIDGDSCRGFEKGGVYYPVRIDDVRKAIVQQAAPR